MQRPPRQHRLPPARQPAVPGKTRERDDELCRDDLGLATGRHQRHAEDRAARPLRSRQRRQSVLAETTNDRAPRPFDRTRGLHGACRAPAERFDPAHAEDKIWPAHIRLDYDFGRARQARSKADREQDAAQTAVGGGREHPSCNGGCFG